MIQGVIFDWDGVVLDSAAAHKQSWERLAAQENLPLPEDHFQRGFGRKNAEIIPSILGWSQDATEIARLGDRKEALYREILLQGGVQPLPGVREFLAQLDTLQLPRSVGSSTPRANIDAALKAMDLVGQFNAIVCADDVRKGKPDPEVFLTAAARLGIEPAACMVLEDATFGLQAAKAAGMLAVGVTTGHSPAELRAAGADLVVARLDELDVAAL